MKRPSLKKKHSTNRLCETYPMRSLSAAELLDIWETGRFASPSRRSLLLLGAALPEEREGLGDVPLGGLTARLLRFRAMLFGPTLNCIATCRSCSGVIESEFDTGELLRQETMDASTGKALHCLTYEDCTVEFRLPTAADLMSIGAVKAHAAGTLAERLISTATHNGASVSIHELPDAVVAAVEKQITKLDPLAYIELSLTCPDCRHSSEEALHVIDFIWLEIGTLARRLLNEVARLASAFGWSEREILALSSERRRCYLELLGT